MSTRRRVILGRWEKCMKDARMWHDMSKRHRQPTAIRAQQLSKYWYEEARRLFDEYVLTPDN